MKIWLKCLVTLSVFLKPNFVVLFDNLFGQVIIPLLAYGISWHLEVRIANQITSPSSRDFRMQCLHFKTDKVMKAKCLLLLKICWSWWIEGEVDLSKSNYTVWLTHIFLFVLSSTLNIFQCHISRQITHCFLFGVDTLFDSFLV